MTADPPACLTHRWRRIATATALVVGGILSGGCYHYRAVAREPASATAVGGSRGVSADGSDTVWSLLWGAVQENPAIDNCEGQDLAEVTVHTNLGFALITVATLGLVAPAEVEWYCAKPDPAPGEIGVRDRAAGGIAVIDMAP